MYCGLIKIKQGNTSIPVRVKDIIRLEGGKNTCTHIFTAGGASYKVCGNIGDWEKDKEIAGSGLFIRVHRSHLVNWSHVYCYNRVDGVTLNDKNTVPLTVEGFDELEKKIFSGQQITPDTFTAMTLARIASFRRLAENKPYVDDEEE